MGAESGKGGLHAEPMLLCVGDVCSAYRHQHGDKFTEGQSQHRHIDGGMLPSAQGIAGYAIDAAHSGELLQKLGGGRNSGFFLAIEIAVDAGVNGTQRNGKGEHSQHRNGSRFQ